MHPTSHFRSDDTALRDRVIQTVGFAAIFLQTPDGPRVAQTPVEWQPDTLIFHLARHNSLTPHLHDARALVLVEGVDAYISARWYEDPNQVPTWNYISYELEGPVSRLDDTALPGLLERLIARQESRIGHGEPWSIDKMDQQKFERMLRGIAGFEMRVECVRETVKLSQNKTAGQRAGLIAGLEREGRSNMAEAMRQVPR
jgi:transcriptional regulator